MIYILIGFVYLSSALPFWNTGFWLIRGFDFPRLQLFTFNLVVLFFYCITFTNNKITAFHVLITLGLFLCLILDLIRIFPYTMLSKKESKNYKNEDHIGQISFLTSNVFIYNRNFNKILDLIKTKDPDVILLLETDELWDKNTKSLLTSHPYSVAIPKENGYGMILYSKFEFVDTEIKILVDKEVPSIFTKLKFDNETIVHLYCLHPRPPRPSDGDSDQRDGELMIASEFIKSNSHKPVIVTGDLNDVAWSHTTRLFKRASHLLDPRVGRGMFSTFHVKYFFFRFPLDHFFHSKKMILAEMKRLPSIGSDHFPLWTKFYILGPDEMTEQQPENLKDTDHDEIKDFQQRGKDWTGPNYVKPE
jgi:endonuclease/exonuclease/phosphatase (EEP) superfamily protein YafD